MKCLYMGVKIKSFPLRWITRLRPELMLDFFVAHVSLWSLSIWSLNSLPEVCLKLKLPIVSDTLRKRCFALRSVPCLVSVQCCSHLLFNHQSLNLMIIYFSSDWY